MGGTKLVSLLLAGSLPSGPRSSSSAPGSNSSGAMNPNMPFTSSPDPSPSQNPLSLMMSQMSKYAMPSSTPLYHNAIKTIATSDDELLPDRPMLPPGSMSGTCLWGRAREGSSCATAASGPEAPAGGGTRSCVLPPTATPNSLNPPSLGTVSSPPCPVPGLSVSLWLGRALWKCGSRSGVRGALLLPRGRDVSGTAFTPRACIRPGFSQLLELSRAQGWLAGRAPLLTARAFSCSGTGTPRAGLASGALSGAQVAPQAALAPRHGSGFGRRQPELLRWRVALPRQMSGFRHLVTRRRGIPACSATALRALKLSDKYFWQFSK